MGWPLLEKIPEYLASVSVESDALLDRFLDFVNTRGLELYPAQEEAILELFAGKNVILNTPTGSGKSLVATALHFHSLGSRRKSVYTCPIKALVNEKFLALCKEFGPEQVGMVTGDATVNRDAPILCCTAEILSNIALREGSLAAIDDVIMDEFHYYSDRDRGVAWQVPLLTMPQTRFLLMSATLGDTDVFEKALTELNERETVVVRSVTRPVPLDYQYAETPLQETIAKLITVGRAPVYVVNFSQRECAEVAQDLLSVDFASKDEKKAIATALEGVKFSSPYGKDIQRLLKHGIGLHHAGLLPRYRILVEKLAQKGLLKIICGTDTLGVGVNVPIRTVLFTKLCKFDGQKTTILSVRDFQQIAGRAGRKGFDDLGTVVAQAPEHIVENVRNEQKAAGDPKKLKKLVKRKPPEKGYVAFNKETFDKLASGRPEALLSRFQITHGMLLSVLSRGPEGGRAMQRLIRDSHESEHAKKQHGKRAFVLLRSLVERKIIEFNPLRVNIDLQDEFSLNQALSLYLLDTIQCLDPQSPDYALDLLTLVESILENPEMILRKQLDRVKTEKMAELKAQGMEFDERIEELDKLEYPKPNRDFIYDSFNRFAASHPWVGQENIRPKSVAREMFENFQSFSEYIRDYDLQRVEGQLLRYLSEVYKVLVQTVPESAKDASANDEVRSIEEFLGTMIRGIDSSLLDEWERLRNPDYVSLSESSIDAEAAATARQASDITRNARALTVLVRNEVFRLVRALASGDFAAALEQLGVGEQSAAQFSDSAPAPAGGSVWNKDEFERLAKLYGADHQRICTDPQARSPQFTQIACEPEFWRIEQVLVDPDGHNDWIMILTMNLSQTRDAGKPLLRLERLGPIE
jgi:superfamily II RNA helicase